MNLEEKYPNFYALEKQVRDLNPSITMRLHLKDYDERTGITVRLGGVHRRFDFTGASDDQLSDKQKSDIFSYVAGL